MFLMKRAGKTVRFFVGESYEQEKRTKNNILSNMWKKSNEIRWKPLNDYWKQLQEMQ